jgi:flagellar biosynthesis component FlhA
MFLHLFLLLPDLYFLVVVFLHVSLVSGFTGHHLMREERKEKKEKRIENKEKRTKKRETRRKKREKRKKKREER